MTLSDADRAAIVERWSYSSNEVARKDIDTLDAALSDAQAERDAALAANHGLSEQHSLHSAALAAARADGERLAEALQDVLDTEGGGYEHFDDHCTPETECCAGHVARALALHRERRPAEEGG